MKAQEERERQARETKAQEEQEWQVRETEALEEQGVQERNTDAQEGQDRKVKALGKHDEEGEGTTREGSVEETKETNSMQEENEVSNRHMTW